MEQIVEQFVAWEDMSELEQLESIYCDMHKDVYGIKARWYRAETVEQARKDLDSLQAALVYEIEQEKKLQAEAIKKFEDLIASYCGDRETAIRWQMQAYDADSTEYLEYCLNLPFGYLRQVK